MDNLKLADEIEAAKNTDRELYRDPAAVGLEYYAPSIHVTEGGGIGINVGGHVVVKPLSDWHALALRAQSETDGWRPMLYDEELYGKVPGAVAAPKNGENILVWAPWMQRPSPAFWCDRTGAWDLDYGMIEDRPSTDPEEYAGLTHWRPLYAPPATGGDNV